MEVTDAIAWPFAIGGAMSERWEFLTDPMEPDYGPPQNRKLRNAPRLFSNFDGLESGANRRWMETLLSANAAGLWHVPMVADNVELAAPLAAGATSIPVSTADRRFQLGGNAILIGSDPRTFQVVEIDAINSDSIGIVGTVTADWPAGTTLAPTIGAQLATAPVLPRFTGNDAPYSVSFRAWEPVDVPADFGEAVYRDFPVFELPIEWSSDPTYVPRRNIEAMDNSVGRVRYYDRAGIVLPVIQFNATCVGREDIGVLYRLVSALSGRWKPIWVPSQAQDIQIVDSPNSVTLTVEWFGYSDWEIQPNRRDIRIEMDDGSVLYRRISSAMEGVENTETLELDVALPGEFDAAKVVCISFMALCCQDADVNSLRLWSYDVIETDFNFRGINNDF